MPGYANLTLSGHGATIDAVGLLTFRMHHQHAELRLVGLTLKNSRGVVDAYGGGCIVHLTSCSIINAHMIDQDQDPGLQGSLSMGAVIQAYDSVTIRLVSCSIA